MAIAANNPIIATTIMISTNVNPRLPCFMVCISLPFFPAAVNDAKGGLLISTICSRIAFCKAVRTGCVAMNTPHLYTVLSGGTISNLKKLLAILILFQIAPYQALASTWTYSPPILFLNVTQPAAQMKIDKREIASPPRNAISLYVNTMRCFPAGT
jgi:hypothetical protein